MEGGRGEGGEEGRAAGGRWVRANCARGLLVVRGVGGKTAAGQRRRAEERGGRLDATARTSLPR
jgi:hypothetical protein